MHNFSRKSIFFKKYESYNKIKSKCEIFRKNVAIPVSGKKIYFLLKIVFWLKKIFLNFHSTKILVSIPVKFRFFTKKIDFVHNFDFSQKKLILYKILIFQKKFDFVKNIDFSQKNWFCTKFWFFTKKLILYKILIFCFYFLLNLNFGPKFWWLPKKIKFSITIFI